MTTDREDVQDNREYSRVDVHLPLEYRLMSSEELDRVSSRLSGDVMLAEFKAMPPLEDSAIAEWLGMINSKLDTVIRMMTLEQEGFYTLPYRRVNIGGGGISFALPKPFRLGDILEMKMMLTMPYPIALYAYGKVVHVEETGQTYWTALHFVMMDDTIREEVIRFVFEKEREILREKRR